MDRPLLFHRTQGLLNPGDRVVPGNWGRMVLGIGPKHTRFLVEYVLERVREAEFPDKPSRLTASFAFEDAAYAQTFNAQAWPHLYAVRIDPSATFHRGDMTWTDTVYDHHTFDGIDRCARQYWAGVEREPNAWELVVQGDLIVEARLTPIPDNGVH